MCQVAPRGLAWKREAEAEWHGFVTVSKPLGEGGVYIKKGKEEGTTTLF